MLSHIDETFVAGDGDVRSYRITHDTDKPARAVVIMQDGTLSRSEYFDLMAGKLAGDGVVGYSLPARRHPGTRVVQHAEDLQQLWSIVNERHPGVPVAIMGVSLGAAITADWNAHFNRRTAVPCVLMSPVLMGRTSWFGLADAAKVAAAMIYRPAAAWPVSSPQSAGAVITSNPKSLEWQAHDPAAKVPAGLFADNTKMLLRSACSGHHNTAPLLILQAGQDAVANNVVSRIWSWFIRGGEKRRITIARAAHDLSQETNNAALMDILAAWLNRQIDARNTLAH